MKRRWIFWLLLVAFVWVVVSNFAEVQMLGHTLRAGDWRWILAGVTIQIVYYVVFSGTYWSSFDTVKVESRLGELIPVTLASLFVNVVAPAGGAGGAALFIDEARRRGQSATRAATATLLQLIADFGAFSALLVAGLGYLFVQHDLQVYEIVGALILLAIVIALCAALILGLRWPGKLRRLLGWLQRVANRLTLRFKQPVWIEDSWVEKILDEYIDAAGAVEQHPLRLVRTFFIALAAHLLDLACLYVVFRAYDQPVAFGTLVAGYAMGVLFWIVAITPQGIGVVEGVMALVYTSLNIPAQVATTISLAFRGLTFWLPLVLGFVLLNQVRTFHSKERRLARDWNVKAVALLTGLMGVVNVFSAVTPSLSPRMATLEQYMPLIVRRGGHLTAALAGFALLLLASSLWRHKRVAWGLTLMVLVLSAISHVVKGLDYEEAVLALALAVWLAALFNHFYARSDMPSLRQGVKVLMFALLFTLAYGVAGFYLLDRHYSVNFGFLTALRQTVVMFTAFYDPGLQPLTHFGRYFAGSIYTVGAFTLSYAALQLARPVFVRSPATAAERQRAKEIVEAYGGSSLARLALMDDKIYFFSQGGSVIAHVVKGRVALALGDPIGPAENLAPAILAFKELCSRNDWIPAFYQVLPTYLAVYQATGFQSLCVGQEAIVDLATFTIAGGENKGMRSAFKRLTKLNYSAQVLDPPISPEVMAELRSISDDWLTAMKGTEKRFSMGWFDNDYIGNGQVMIVCSPDGQINAFANIVPEYQLNEITIDLMRHRRETENGLMDYLFVSLFQWAKVQGYATFNLGLSALSGIGEQPGDPAVERALHFIFEHVNQFYNFKGLYAFKEKFHPQWSPRYLIFPTVSDLPVVTLAMVNADSGGENILRGYLQKKAAGSRSDEV